MKKHKSAFSFIELAVVILIISLMLAAVMQTGKIIHSSRLSTAQKATANSAARNIGDIYAWFETTLPKSFIEEEAQDYATKANDGVSKWYDINPNPLPRKNAIQGFASQKPRYYENCINALPCLKFDGSDDHLFFAAAGFENTDYSIFIIEQRNSGGEAIFIGNSGTKDKSMSVGYDSSDQPFIAQGNNIDYRFSSVGSFSNATPRLHAFIVSTLQAGQSEANHYLNGSDSASTITKTTSFDNLSLNSSILGIGKEYHSSSNYDGDIGEIIIFTKPLNNVERRSVEEYLLKKWHIKRSS